LSGINYQEENVLLSLGLEPLTLGLQALPTVKEWNGNNLVQTRQRTFEKCLKMRIEQLI